MDLLNSISQVPSGAFFALYLWTILLKGLALWKAAKLNQRNWFVGILILNTLGILEIAYLFFFATKRLKLQELMIWKKK